MEQCGQYRTMSRRSLHFRSIACNEGKESPAVSSSVAGKPEQHEEQVDEVQIERQSAQDGWFSSLSPLSSHFFDLPGIVCGKSGEDDHPDAGYDPGYRTAF